MSKNKQTLNNVKLVDDIVSGDQTLAYDNSTSGLTATNIQSAVDEVQSNKVEKASNQALSTDSNSFFLESNALKLKRANGDVDTVDLSAYLDDTTNTIVSGTLSGNLITFTREDDSTFTVDVAALYDDTNLVTSVNGETGAIDLSETYEPKDITILKDVDIGVTVQAYNADTVVDSSYVHTDNNYTTAEKSKLSGIESGATADQTKADIDALGINADSVDGVQASAITYSGKNVSLTGDVSGSTTVSTDGSISISTTVADDSHNHVISNIDGLQTALNGKQPSGSYVTTNSNQALGTDTNAMYVEGNVLKLKRANGDIDSVDLSLYLDDTNLSKITSGSVDGNGLATFTRDDASTFTVDFSVLFDDTNLSRITSAAFNSGTGVITLTRNDSSVAGTVDIDGRYLPLSGGTITGDIAVSGTVDGRDVSVDGTKLDGIESGATADQSASEILALVKTVDGSGSGLDADLLDGQSSDYYAIGTHTHDRIYTGSNNLRLSSSNELELFDGGGGITRLHLNHSGALDSLYGPGGNQIWHAGNDGSGSGLDADLLDGQQSSAFAAASHSHSYLPLSGGTVTGVIDTGNAGAAAYRFDGRSFSWNSAMQNPTTSIPHIMQRSYSGWDPVLGIKTTNGFWQFGAYSGNTLHLGYMAGAFGSHSTNGFDNSLDISPSTMTFNGNTVWHAGNDGSGSGLDADTVDGKHASELGPTGGGNDKIFSLNDQVITTSYSIPSGQNAMTAGPITINNNVTITVPDGSSWTIV